MSVAETKPQPWTLTGTRHQTGIQPELRGSQRESGKRCAHLRAQGG
jgi:hypothetical protein